MSKSRLSRTVPRGRLLWLVATALPVSALAPIVSPLIGLVWIVTLVILAVLDLLLATRSPIGFTVELPEIVRLSKDRSGVIPVMIKNAALKKPLKLGLPLPREIESRFERDVQIPPNCPHSLLEWECLPRKRGKYSVHNVHVEVASPFGFWSRRVEMPIRSEVRVYPNLFEERKKLAALFLNRADYGIHARRMIGQGREFEKLREYVHGDSYDQIHWKATAKKRRPITKVYQLERTQEVYVVIDSSRLVAREISSETILEFFIRSALILGMAAQRQGDLFGTISFSNRVQGFLRAGGGKKHYGACRDLLYLLQPQLVTPDFEDLFSLIRLRLRRRALLIILTDLTDPVLAENFVRSAQLVARQHLMLVNMVRPQGAHQLFTQENAKTVDSLYENLAGHVAWQNLEDLRNVLHRYGIQFLQLNTASMSAELVSQYMNVKQRQLL